MSLAPSLERPSQSQDYLWTLNFGPQHPATHTTLRLVLKLDGERVIEAVPDIGYLHSGFEKLGEHLNYNQYVTITDRMNYISPVANGVAWHGAVERLLGIEITPRCKYIRTIVAELARISDHLLCTGAMGLAQLMPSTARFLGVQQPFDPRQSVYGGAKFLRLLANRFGGDMVLVLAGYFSGAGAVQKYGGVPPHPGVRAYVKAVLRRFYAYERVSQGGAGSASPARAIAGP